MKIGITLNTSFISFFSNGHVFNVYLWYSFLTNCGFDCYFLIEKKEVSFQLKRELMRILLLIALKK